MYLCETLNTVCMQLSHTSDMQMYLTTVGSIKLYKESQLLPKWATGNIILRLCYTNPSWVLVILKDEYAVCSSPNLRRSVPYPVQFCMLGCSSSMLYQELSSNEEDSESMGRAYLLSWYHFYSYGGILVLYLFPIRSAEEWNWRLSDDQQYKNTANYWYEELVMYYGLTDNFFLCSLPYSIVIINVVCLWQWRAPPFKPLRLAPLCIFHFVLILHQMLF